MQVVDDGKKKSDQIENEYGIFTLNEWEIRVDFYPHATQRNSNDSTNCSYGF